MKKTLLSLSLASALALPVAAPVVAQEQTAQPVKADERIKITASRTEQTTASIPATVTVIDGEDLRQQLASADTLSDVLGNLVPASHLRARS